MWHMLSHNTVMWQNQEETTTGKHTTNLKRHLINLNTGPKLIPRGSSTFQTTCRADVCCVGHVFASYIYYYCTACTQKLLITSLCLQLPCFINVDQVERFSAEFAGYEQRTAVHTVTVQNVLEWNFSLRHLKVPYLYTTSILLIQ